MSITVDNISDEQITLASSATRPETISWSSCLVAWGMMQWPGTGDLDRQNIIKACTIALSLLSGPAAIDEARAIIVRLYDFTARSRRSPRESSTLAKQKEPRMSMFQCWEVKMWWRASAAGEQPDRLFESAVNTGWPVGTGSIQVLQEAAAMRDVDLEKCHNVSAEQIGQPYEMPDIKPGTPTSRPGRMVRYDSVARDPQGFLRAVAEASGQELDARGQHLDVERQLNEVDESFRERIVTAASSCRGQVHVLGIDPASWHHCQCGANPALSETAVETAVAAMTADPSRPPSATKVDPIARRQQLEHVILTELESFDAGGGSTEDAAISNLLRMVVGLFRRQRSR